MAGTPPPFRAERYDLPPPHAGFHLSAIRADEASGWGERCASMEPWTTYRTPASVFTVLFRPPTLSDGGVRLALRDADGTARGIALVRHPWLTGPYMQFLVVDPALQGQGLGSAVLAWMEREARHAGARNVWICHYEHNPDAARLYQRLGFVPVTRLDDLIQDGFHEILMRKRIV